MSLPAQAALQRRAWRYGVFGAPLAFMALPLSVHLPAFYGGTLGVSLAALGLLLVLLRSLDALLDPWLGRLADATLRRGGPWPLALLGGCALLMGLGFAALFMPPLQGQAALLAWCGTALAISYAACSLATVLHLAWGARLGGDAATQAGRVAWREGAALAGVVLASVLPGVVGWATTAAVLMLALAAGCWALRGQAPSVAVAAVSSSQEPRVTPRPSLTEPLRHAVFRRLLLVYLINGIASAVPATLVLFFVRDRLQAPAWEGAFLALYFVAAAASLPLWLRLAQRWGLARTWAAGMALAILSFLGTHWLGAGDVLGFAAICLASGLALGADLVAPNALLAHWLAGGRAVGSAEATKQPEHHAAWAGVCFGWWHAATKLNLALAAGLALPLLSLLGYAPGARDALALQALSLSYGILPCLLKLLALGCWWRLGCVKQGD